MYEVKIEKLRITCAQYYNNKASNTSFKNIIEAISN